MARYSVAGRSTVVGTTVRAVASLFAIASRTGKIRQITVSNSTATAVQVAVCRFTNATGVGAGLTEVLYDEFSPAPNCTGFAGHTADGAVGANIDYVSLGAAVGSGWVWTYGDTGLLIQAGTANGIGIICPINTGQILDYSIHWDE
jgi:hypothetical protein